MVKTLSMSQDECMRILVISCLSILVSLIYYKIHLNGAICQCTKVVLLDVGQGSGLYIQSGEEEILIDTGETHKTLRELGKIRDPLDTTLEHLFLTHADRDHIGRAPELLERLKVRKIYFNGYGREDVISRAIHESGTPKQVLRAGNTIKIGEVFIKVLWPNGDHDENKNDSSLVMKLTVGEHTLLAAGDITKSVEKELIYIYGDDLRSDILLVPHHGSKSSTSEVFLNVVQPQVALISAGKDNRFGHPHQEVIDRLRRFDVQIFNTAEFGSVTFYLEHNGSGIILDK